MMMTMMMMIMMMMMMVMMDGDDDDDDDDDDGDDAQNFYLGFDIVPAIFWRIPKLSEKDATSLLPPEGVDFENTSGLGLQALQDFQKLYGCKQVVDEDTPMESFSVQEKSDMKTRVTGCDKYSARLNLLFRTNVTLKTWVPKIGVACNLFKQFQALAVVFFVV